MIAIEGGTFNSASPINAKADAYDGSGSDSTGNIPNITTDRPNCLGLGMAMGRTNVTSYPTTGGSPDYTGRRAQFPVSSIAARLATIPFASAGTDGAATFSLGSAVIDGGVLVAINPAES